MIAQILYEIPVCMYMYTYDHLLVSPPMVKIISSMADPLLSGSSLRLICIIEWMMPVPRPIDLQAMWTGPNGSSLTSDLVTETPSRYTSEVELDSIDSTYEGEYTCTVNIGKETNISESAKKTLIVGKHMLLQRINIQQAYLSKATKDIVLNLHMPTCTVLYIKIKIHR